MDKLRRSSRAIYSLGETVSPPVLATAMMHLRGWFELFLSHVVGWFVLFPRYLSLFRRSQIGGELGQWSAAAAVAAAASVSGSPPVRRLSPPWSSPRVAAGRDPNSQTILRRLLSGSPSYASLLFPVTSELAGGQFVFSRDLKQCPTFSKLKSLLLNEYWCMAPDLDPLACSLKNSPVLEKLSLQLFSNGGDIIEMIGSYSSVERSSAISEHLKIVEVKFHEMDKTTRKVLKFLCTFNIRFRIE
ncbi:hypothetical protein ACQ4PT_031410 [Festuca glaucescens]